MGALASTPVNPVPDSLARAARVEARSGGVLGTAHGNATARMRALSVRLVELRFSASENPGAVRQALCIIRGESGFNPGAVSETGDYGLAQLNRAAHEGAHPAWWLGARGFRYLALDPAFSVGIMWSMSKRGTDWSAWTGTWGRGLCR